MRQTMNDKAVQLLKELVGIADIYRKQNEWDYVGEIRAYMDIADKAKKLIKQEEDDNVD